MLFVLHVCSIPLIITAGLTPPTQKILSMRSFGLSNIFYLLRNDLQLILCNEMKLNLHTNVSKSVHPNIKQRGAEM